MTTVFFGKRGSSLQLWTTDGSVSGLVSTIDPSTTSGDDITQLTAYGNQVVFSGTSGSSDYQPWISNGTAQGTATIANIGLGGAKNVADFTPIGDDDFVFESPLNGGTELWNWNGATATVLGFYAKGVSDLKSVGGQLYFLSGDDLYSTNGAEVAYVAGSASAAVKDFTNIGGITYYAAGSQIYKLVADKTTQLTDFGDDNNSESDLAAGPGGELIFAQFDDNYQTAPYGQFTIWTSNGVPGDAVSIGTFSNGSLSYISLQGFYDIGGVEYAVVDGELYPGETSAGLESLNSGTLVGVASAATNGGLATIEDLTDVGGKLYFVSSQQNGEQIWTANASAGSATMVTDLPQFADPTNLTNVNGSLYFEASDDNTEYLYRLTADDDVQLVAGGVDPSAGIAFTDSPYLYSSYLSSVSTNLDGAGLSDILWRDTNGDVDIWNANAGSAPASFAVEPVSYVSTDWQIAGVGDFNGSGVDGVLWRDANGDVTTWNALPSSPESFADEGGLTYGVTADWQVAGVGDFNGDGLSDVLWRDANGDVDIWNANPGSFPASFAAQPVSYVSTDWQIAGVGDFNGSGVDGILWRDANGDVTTWNALQSSPESFANEGGLTYNVTTDWQVAGVGDFNGDGQSDILWRDTNGDVDIWTANPGSSPASFKAQPVTYVSTDWQIKGVGDYNGDGKADILWQNVNTGDVTVWESNPTSLTYTPVNLGVVSADWHVASA